MFNEMVFCVKHTCKWGGASGGGIVPGGGITVIVGSKDGRPKGGLVGGGGPLIMPNGGGGGRKSGGGPRIIELGGGAELWKFRVDCSSILKKLIQSVHLFQINKITHTQYLYCYYINLKL